MERKGIALGGSILVDVINHISSYPNLGSLSTISNVEQAVGGLVPNDSIDIKKIDSSIDVYAYGKVGSDEKGQYVLRVLKQNNIDVSNIKILDKGVTSFTQVMSLDGGERTFFSHTGLSGDFGYDDIDFDSITARIFHLGYFLLLDKVDSGDGLKILKKLKELGIETSIDFVSSKPDLYEKLVPCLNYVDYLIINELEAMGLTNISTCDDLEKLAKKLYELGVKKKVIIHKADKACIYDGFSYLEMDSLNIPSHLIKGKTGAGDAFCSACLTEIYKGSSNKEILDFAIKAAAMSLFSDDATSSMKSKQEIINSMSEFERR